MAAWLVFSLAVLGQTANSASASTPKTDDVREISTIRKEVSDLLRTESAATKDAARGRQVRRMAEVYLEVVGDERFITNPLLQQTKSKLHTRLLKIRDDLKRRRSIDQRNEPKRSRNDDDLPQREVAASLASHLQLASQTLGGPAAVFEGAAGGAPIDFADDLIDLITETISPTHWNVNGGEGSIMFYRPALALVVRASSEVQSGVGGLLGGLRE